MGVGLWNFEILKPQGETRSHAQSCLLKVVLKSETKFSSLHAFTKVDFFWERMNVFESIIQGDPNQNFPFQMAITLKLSSSDPMLVKPKCVWEAAVFFSILKFFFIFQLFVYNFSKKAATSQTHFGFINIGSKELSFGFTAISKGKLWFRAPCIIQGTGQILGKVLNHTKLESLFLSISFEMKFFFNCW